jgi:SAM-dependent methyltransferase
MRKVFNQKQWAKVSKDLEQENLKLASYDYTLLPLLEGRGTAKVLDYGCGPGVLASTLSKLGFRVKAYDVSEKMRALCGNKIGLNNVYDSTTAISKAHFDYVICNLVMCIVEESEVESISRNIRNVLKKSGFAYIGFCNPKIFDVPESALDVRKQTKHGYNQNHVYEKVKKEGNYEILEMHRPIEWYKKIFKKTGLECVDTVFTPEYEFKGRKINDFIIFKLAKGK